MSASTHDILLCFCYVFFFCQNNAAHTDVFDWSFFCPIPRSLINIHNILNYLFHKLNCTTYCAVLLHTFINARVSTDPCKDNANSLNTMCRVEAITRKPLFFGLPESCPPGGEPLCASDGETYPSECVMTSTGMQKGIKLRKIHAGRCRRLGEDNLCLFCILALLPCH